MLNELKRRYDNVVMNEEGASTLEWIIFAGVAFLIAVALFRFGHGVSDFVDRSNSKVGEWSSNIDNAN